MRIRTLIAVGLLAMAGMAFTAAPAGAAGDADEECLHILEDGGTLDDCHSAPSPLIPEMAEFVWGGLSFLVVFAILAKFAYPAMKKGLKNREDQIRGDLEEAEQAKTDAEATRADYERQLAEARIEAGKILEEARQAADQVRKDLVAQAESDAADIRTRAEGDIAAMRERAVADLRGNVAELSIELAEKVVERNLDADTQRALIDSYIDQVGSTN